MNAPRRDPRVLFVDQTAQLGGAELALLDLVREAPFHATVLLFEPGPLQQELEAVGVPVIVEPAAASVLGVRREEPAWAGLRAFPALARPIAALARRARSFDLLYANSQKAFVVAALAGVLARRPVVWHLHDVLTAAHFSRAHRAVGVALAWACAARVVANSQATARAFAEAGGPAGRVRVVYNGIDAAPFDAVQPEEVEALREALGLAGAPVVGVFGRLAPWKGQHVLLESLARLPRVHALLVGGPLFGEEAYEAELRRQADRLGLASRVHLLGFRRDVAPLMHCCDIVAHTSVAPEPFGRVIVEAMLAGRPVVAARAGGALEIVEDGMSGLLVKPGDSGALAEALQVLLEEPQLGRRLAAAAGVRARSAFSPRAATDGVVRVVEEVLAR